MNLKRLPTFVKAVGLVTVISAVGKLLGFIREAIIAAYFGTTTLADVFFVANLVPTILFTAVGTAIQAGIIPLYVEEKEKSQSGADRLMSILGTFFFIIALLITVLTIFFAKPLVHLVAPGFTEEQRKLTVLLVQIMSPSICFLALTSIATGVLNANKRFVLPAFTATAHNIVIIIATIVLAKSYGVIGLSVGVLIGAASQFLIQYPQLKQYAIRFERSFWQERERVKSTIYMFYPIIIAALAVQLNGVVDRMISSGLEEGSVSALNYGSRLMWLPLSVILTPLITVLYPSIVEAVLKGFGEFLEIVTKGIRMIVFLAVPFLVVMLICGQSLIELAFERGAFNQEATMMTTQTFFFYSVGLIFFALRDYLMNCFYALKATKVAMYSCLITVAINVGLSLSLARVLSAGGIALASSISMVIQTVFLLIYLWKKTKPEQSFLISFFKDIGKLILLFALVLMLVCWVHGGVDHLSAILKVIVVSFITFVTFLVGAFVLRVKEVESVVKMVLRK
ncbi:murein biosynthesis integral membrane protein MurJ [Bacillus sp. PS06]|uniref:murein biosynthesis integral membrane protein MurJ n=1 Tax=Bacillus sp. PS06 TaxID=2764176 RepID=UPI001785762D|nr:murein biosynthesis integral membrane protein MurJ [Bacillus sp. PS06]MBD8070545.1 murein biosynthesis integral membrane protein MurJ [Bacillus sp. PS06]